MSGGEAINGIGVKHSRLREPLRCERNAASPGVATLLTATPERLPPEAKHSVSECSGTECFASGGKRSGVAVKRVATPGLAALRSQRNGSLNLECFTPIPLIASPPDIRDKSRMR